MEVRSPPCRTCKIICTMFVVAASDSMQTATGIFRPKSSCLGPRVRWVRRHSCLSDEKPQMVQGRPASHLSSSDETAADGSKACCSDGNRRSRE